MKKICLREHHNQNIRAHAEWVWAEAVPSDQIWSECPAFAEEHDPDGWFKILNVPLTDGVHWGDFVRPVMCITEIEEVDEDNSKVAYWLEWSPGDPIVNRGEQRH